MNVTLLRYFIEILNNRQTLIIPDFLTYLLKPCGGIKINARQTTVKEKTTVALTFLFGFFFNLPKYICAYINAFELVLPLSKDIHNSERKIEIYEFVADFTYAKVSIKTIKEK